MLTAPRRHWTGSWAWRSAQTTTSPTKPFQPRRIRRPLVDPSSRVRATPTFRGCGQSSSTSPGLAHVESGCVRKNGRADARRSVPACWSPWPASPGDLHPISAARSPFTGWPRLIVRTRPSTPTSRTCAGSSRTTPGRPRYVLTVTAWASIRRGCHEWRADRRRAGARGARGARSGRRREEWPTVEWQTQGAAAAGAPLSAGRAGATAPAPPSKRVGSSVRVDAGTTRRARPAMVAQRTRSGRRRPSSPGGRFGGAS